MFKKKKKLKRTRIIPKLILLSFIIIASVQAISALVIFSAPEFSQAAIQLKPNTPIGDDKPIVFNTGNTQPIADYVATVYEYAIGVVGIVAAVMMMIGGLIWLTAGGNATQVSKAKSYIGASLGGLVLALGSYLILAQVNPALVDPTISTITAINSGIEQQTTTIPSNANCKAEEKTLPNPSSTNSEGALRSPDSYCPGMSTIESTLDSTGLGTGALKTRDFCYCTYNPLDKYQWRQDYCEDGQKEITRDETKGIPLCGSNIGDNTICCGPELPVECKKSPRCKPVKGTPTVLTLFQGLKCNNIRSCQTNQELAKRLKTLGENYEQDLIITEAWPPMPDPKTGEDIHRDECHYIGTCVDLRSWNLPQDNLQNLIEYARDAGLRAEYECKDAGCCTGWPTGTCLELGDHITGPHFSVYLD